MLCSGVKIYKTVLVRLLKSKIQNPRENIPRALYIYAKIKGIGEMCKRCDVCMKVIEIYREWNITLVMMECL